MKRSISPLGRQQHQECPVVAAVVSAWMAAVEGFPRLGGRSLIRSAKKKYMRKKKKKKEINGGRNEEG